MTIQHGEKYFLLGVLAFCILFLLIHAPLLSYTFKTWTVEEGLPQNSVLCLLQDKTGYIWFGTQSGLVKFDGVAFHVYNRWNIDRLNSDKFTTLYEDYGGNLWVGSDGSGLCRLKNHKWTLYTINEGLAHDSIRVLHGDREGNLWIGTANGLNCLPRGKEKFETFAAGANNDPWGNTITAITGNAPSAGSANGANEVLWIGTNDNGLYFLKKGEYHPYKAEGELINSGITALYEDLSGRLWIGTQNGLLCMENGQIQRPVSQDHPLFNNTVRSFFMDSRGILWIGTDGEGIFQFNGNTFSRLPLGTELSDDFIYTFMEDREANIWIGTFTGGLTRLTHARVTSITSTNGLPKNLVSTLLEDKNGNLWVGMERKGLVKIKYDKVVDTLPVAGITALYQDNDNNLWLGTQKNGIMKLADNNLRSLTTYTSREGLSSNEITAIRGDKSGNIWIGTTNGLNRFEKGKFIHYLLKKDKTNFPVHIKAIEIEENSPSTLWVGTTQGLLRLNGDHLEEVLTSTSKFVGYDIQCLYADRRGNLWIGANGSGLGRFVKGMFSSFTSDSGLPSNYIFSILEDNQNNLWMSSYKGIFRVPIAQLDGLAQKKIQTLTPLYLDEKDGMASSECAKDGQPSAWKNAAGKLYIPTVKGVAVIDPALITLNNILPPVIIEDVLVNNESMTNRVNPVFRPGKNMIEFYFTALSFTAPGKVILRYKLEGFDSRWVELVPREKRAALYLNLGPGNYRFLVTACNSDGLWNEKGAAYEFKIRYPFYKQPLFYWLMVALLLAASAGTSWWFYRRKLHFQLETKHKPDEPKYKTSALLPETVEEVLPRLLQLMEKEKIFLKADLNLKSLAQRLNVHYNYLSQIINERLNHSFNDFINSYRIEEAKKKLQDPAEKDKTILDIAYDTGFYSKSVFNTAFKKFTGMTPSEFKHATRTTRL